MDLHFFISKDKRFNRLHTPIAPHLAVINSSVLVYEPMRSLGNIEKYRQHTIYTSFDPGDKIKLLMKEQWT